MSAYLQMGHDSWNQLSEDDGGRYGGIVLSPVNDAPQTVADRLRRLADQRSDLEVILDPQLYNPAVDKGKLSEWPFRRVDYETADHSDEQWWVARGAEVVSAAKGLGIEAICSPAIRPREYTDDYYRFTVNIADHTARHASACGVETLLTAMVPLKQMANPRRALELASVLTATDCERVYVVVVAEEGMQQREPLTDEQGLAGMVHLVRLLSGAMRVHVAFCSHDMVLWKASGATDVSTGKFMNLRRFSPGRWEDDESKARNQVWYWNEPRLLTLLRDQDVLRLDQAGWFANRSFDTNPAAKRILDILRAGTGEAWQRLAWFQYLRWFSNAEASFADPTAAMLAINLVDKNWGEVEKLRRSMIDRYNDGSHIRIWKNALSDGGRR